MIMIVPFAEEEFLAALLIDCSEIHFTRVGECSQVVFDGRQSLKPLFDGAVNLNSLMASHCTGLGCGAGVHAPCFSKMSGGCQKGVTKTGCHTALYRGVS